MSWGEIDILWTIIFMIIIAVILYWTYTIYTGNRPYITQTTFISSKTHTLNNVSINNLENDSDTEFDSDTDTDDSSD